MSTENSNNLGMQHEIPLDSQIELLNKLEHLAGYADKLVVLMGPHHSGKTTIMNRLKQRVEKNIPAYLASAKQTNWLTPILEEMGIDNDANRHSFQLAMAEFLPAHDVVLLIDDAEQLSPDQLELLIDKMPDENFHCVIAINDPSEALRHMATLTGSVIIEAVAPLSQSEQFAFLQSINKMELDEALLAELALSSPMYIDDLVAQYDNLHGNRDLRSNGDRAGSSNQRLLLGIGLIAAAITLAVSFLWFQDTLVVADSLPGHNESVTGSGLQEQTASSLNTSESNPANDGQLNPSETENNPSDEQVIGADSQAAPTINKLTEPEAVTAPDVDESGSAQVSADESFITSVMDKPSPASGSVEVSSSSQQKAAKVAQDVAANSSSTTQLSGSLNAVNAVPVSGKATEKTIKTTTEESTDESTEKNADTAVPSEAVSTGERARPSSEPVVVSLSDDEQQLLSSDPSQWALQFGSFSNENNAMQLAAQLESVTPTLVYRKISAKGTVFTLVGLPQTDRSSADKQRRMIVQQGITINPWAKPLLRIHQEINRYKITVLEQ